MNNGDFFMLTAISIFAGYLVISAVHFYRIIGDKYRKDKWYDYIFIPGWYIILYLILWPICLTLQFLGLMEKR